MITYIDIKLYSEILKHPGLTLDKNHPCVKLKRYAKSGKSYFKLNKKQAVQVYRYYKNTWGEEVQDEFGEKIFNFQEVLGNSYCEEDSTLTIKELYDAMKVEQKLLESLGKEG